MVRFHMVDDQIIDMSVTYGIMYIVYEFILKAMLHRINKSNLFICNNIRVIADTVRQLPQSLKKDLVGIIYSYRIYSITYLHYKKHLSLMYVSRKELIICSHIYQSMT